MPSRVIAVIVFGGFWILGNVGGNYVGWEVIFKWFEVTNGDATIDPIWTHPLVFLALAIGASSGQLWRDWFGVEDKWKWGVYTVMALDLGINTIGLYYLVMRTFTFPPVWGMFIFLAGLAFIPNVGCQSLATHNLKKLLEENATKKPAKTPKPVMQKPEPKAELPIVGDIVPAQRRTNGSIPMQVEDAK